MKKHTVRSEHHKDGPDFCTIGIDVSKHHLDACELPSGREARFPNTKEGVRAFSAWACPRVARVVYESTGSYHLLLEDLLVDRLPLSRINPRRGKRFAEALGSEAKTDRADALVLAKMGRAMADDLMETPVRTRREKDLDELRAARDAVNKALTVLKGRREHARNRLVRREIEKDIARAKRQIGRLDQELERLVATDAELSRKVTLLVTIPGIARPTAIGLLVETPELGTLSTREAGSLLGLAPLSNDSGSRRGKRSIQGGRKRARTLLYMPTLAAIRWNPVLRERHLQFKQRGKPGKVAVTAAMRKMVLIANAVIRDGKPWQLDHVPMPAHNAA